MRILAFILWLLPTMGLTQAAATLVADTVSLNAQDQLIAQGNVEVLFDGSRLTATALLYDRQTDTLQVTGPIFIRASDGTILTASSASLDPRLENGILLGARIVLDQQLQLVAAQINEQGRYSQLYKTTVTSCRVCGDRSPLWEIRSERVIRDAQERQLYFENATFRVRGVPVLWLPRMRLPDPTLERATGFLVPEQRNTTQLGTGLKTPYFIALGDYRDLTVTPYVSSETSTLELRYRQAFARGDIEIEGALSNDTLRDVTRGYVFAQGDFTLANGSQLSLDVQTTSDSAYLLDYGYSEKDRLESAIALLRVTDATLFQTRLTYFESLRTDEDNASLPPIVADLSYERRTTPAVGGHLSYRISLDSEYRPSNTDGAAGRDVTRAGAAVAWDTNTVLGAGVIAQTHLGARADLYLVDDDSSFDTSFVRLVPDASVTLRLPLARIGNGGVTHVVEPTVFAGWADRLGQSPPIEDSTRSELDRANLFDTSRFTGDDAVQTGAQAALGVTWSRLAPNATTSILSFGRVVRQDSNAAFTASSGLNGTQSDWLVAGQISTAGGFLLDGRSLWDDDGGLTVADGRIAWRNDQIDLGANYHWQTPDAAEDRTQNVSEWTFDAAFDINAAWTLELDGRYDVAADQPLRAGIGVQWRNECVSIDVSASRRYTTSSTVEPTTTFGLSGSIGGFSTGRATGGIATGCGN